jgi:hypothetical protein
MLAPLEGVSPACTPPLRPASQPFAQLPFFVNVLDSFQALDVPIPSAEDEFVGLEANMAAPPPRPSTEGRMRVGRGRRASSPQRAATCSAGRKRAVEEVERSDFAGRRGDMGSRAKSAQGGGRRRPVSEPCPAAPREVERPRSTEAVRNILETIRASSAAALEAGLGADSVHLGECGPEPTAVEVLEGQRRMELEAIDRDKVTMAKSIEVCGSPCVWRGQLCKSLLALT